MPHTTRPEKNQKPSQNKRTTITDDSGWSHVTTTTRARRTYKNTGQEKTTKTEKEELKPAEAPSNLTLDDLRQQFNRHHERWAASESWGVVRRNILSLHASTDRSTSADANADAPTDTVTEGIIENIICIGLGSPSGFLRGGWVDRRQVSLVQLAALVSIKELFRTSHSSRSNSNLSNVTNRKCACIHPRPRLQHSGQSTLRIPGLDSCRPPGWF